MRPRVERIRLLASSMMRQSAVVVTNPCPECAPHQLVVRDLAGEHPAVLPQVSASPAASSSRLRSGDSPAPAGLAVFGGTGIACSTAKAIVTNRTRNERLSRYLRSERGLRGLAAVTVCAALSAHGRRRFARLLGERVAPVVVPEVQVMRITTSTAGRDTLAGFPAPHRSGNALFRSA